MINVRPKGSCYFAGLLFGLAAAPSFAVLEEVIVTAQKKSQNLQDVAVAVSAFNADTIRNAGMLDISDVTAMTPGFSVSNYNPTTPAPYIRGIGTNSSSIGDDASVGVFIDEVYAGRAGGYSANMLDVERIEVLRGPQGTLYGRNVAGGALNIHTKNPTNETEGRVGVTVGSYDLTVVEGAIGGSLSDSVRGRVAFSKRDRNGHVDNILTGNKLKDEDNLTFRTKLDFDISDTASLLLTVDYSEDDFVGPAARGVVGLLPTIEGSPVDKVSLLNDGFSEREMFGISAKASIEMAGGILTSITAYRQNDYAFYDDYTGNWPVGRLTNEAEEESQQFTQELRFTASVDSLEYTVGVYYFSEDVDRLETFDSSATIAVPGASRPLWDGSNESTSYSAFGELSYHVTDNFSINVGGRYTKDDKDFETVASTPDVFGFLAEPYDVKADESWSEFSPKIGLNYKINDDILVYFTGARGYKAGGFNGIAATEAEAVIPFKPEVVTSSELGIKSEFANNTVRVNANVFYMDYEDLQNFFVDPAVGEVTTASADAEMKGVELEIWLSPFDGLDVFLSGNWLDTEYTTFESNPAVVGNNLMRAPEHTAALGFQYRLQLSGNNSLLFRTDATYSDQMFFNTTNTEISSAEDYTLVSARLAWQTEAGFELALWGRNLSDEDYVVHSFTFGAGDGHPVYGNPRMVGVSASFTF